MKIIVNSLDAVHVPDDAETLLGIFVPSSEVYKIDYEKRIPIDFEIATYHAERVRNAHKDSDTYCWEVFSTYNRSWREDAAVGKMKYYSTGEKFVFGMIDMILKFQDSNIPFVLVHPESALHPSTVLRLTDVLIDLAWRGTDEEFLFKSLLRQRVPEYDT